MEKKEFDEIIRQSQSFESFKPSYEDIVRFHSQSTRLLLSLESYALPIETQIRRILDGGAYFSFSNGWQEQWVPIQDVTVLWIFPPRDLVLRLNELKRGNAKKEQQTDHKAIEDALLRAATKFYDAETVDRIFGSAPKPEKKKKCKKKKKCPTE